MTSLERAFLDDIIANPGDDTPRLIFADWLDENGQEERAEFIRVQCELAHLEGPKQSDGRSAGWFCNRTGTWTAWGRWGKRCRCQLCSLRRREYETSKRWCVWEWREGIPQTITVDYRRGFVTEVECPLATWLEHGPTIVRQHPVEVVTAADCEPLYSGQEKQEETNFIIHPGFYVWGKMIRFHGDDWRRHRLRWEIPPELWGEELDGSFDTEEDAMSALSKVLIRKANDLNRRNYEEAQ